MNIVNVDIQYTLDMVINGVKSDSYVCLIMLVT